VPVPTHRPARKPSVLPYGSVLYGSEFLEQRVLVLNLFDEIDPPKVAYTVPEILEPAQLKKLLETAEEELPELIPYLAMVGFAGVRRSELVREYAEDQALEWEDVDWQKQLITVRHEVAKQTSRKMANRRFIPMEAALLHWLVPYRKEEGLLIPLVDSAVTTTNEKAMPPLKSKSAQQCSSSFVCFVLAGAFKKRGTGRAFQTNGQF
jgi:integrase